LVDFWERTLICWHRRILKGSSHEKSRAKRRLSSHELLAFFWVGCDDFSNSDLLVLDVNGDIHFIPDWNHAPSRVLDVATGTDSERSIVDPLLRSLKYAPIRLSGLQQLKGSIRGGR